jgi:hypothetical protein
MKISKLTGLGFWLVVLLNTSSCYFTSLHPLPIKAELDRELIGCWKSLPEKDQKPQTSGWVLFLEDQNGTLQIVLMKNAYQYEEMYRGFCSEINGEKYLNVKLISLGTGVQKPEMDKNYYLVHYRIDHRKRLETRLLREEGLKQAVKDRRLQGTLLGKSEELTLTDTTENLLAYIQAQKPEVLLGEKLFDAEKTNQLPKPQTR